MCQSSAQVKEPWIVVGIELVGPLSETDTIFHCDLACVVAEPLQTKHAAKVAAAVLSSFILFGMVHKIIMDQGKELINEYVFRGHDLGSLFHFASVPPHRMYYLSFNFSLGGLSHLF